MRKRFKIPLIIVSFLMAFCLFLGICYLFYDKLTNDTIVLVDNALSINFINSQKFDYKNKENKFTVTNNGKEKVYYYIELTKIFGTGTYTLESEELNLSGDIIPKTLSSYIAIEPGTTQKYSIKFSGDDFSGVINVKTENSSYETFSDIIIKNSEIKNEPVTSLGEAATTNEGLIKSSDDYGTSYYFRGAITNNYVSFVGNLWRIVRINGDGSIKLVLNNSLSTVNSYYEKKTNDFSYNGSDIKLYLDNYFKTNFETKTDYIATINYCNDILKDNDSYSAYNRIMIDKIITFKCLSEKVPSTIGLLTIDEVVAAGASTTGENTEFYLYNKEITTNYYTMSSAKLSQEYYPFMVKPNGAIDTSVSGTLNRGIRPVINVIKNVSANGNGTIDNPYTIVAIATK